MAWEDKVREGCIVRPSAMEVSWAARDVFLKQFDITWAANGNIEKTLTFNPVEAANPDRDVIDDGTVIYNYNNEWFRCDDFTNEKTNKYHIVFSGCSETEGIGGNLDTVWTKMVHSSLKEKYDVGNFYSLAKAGNGWQKIISNFMIYREKYGTPTHLFVLMSNIDRMFAWHKEDRCWRYHQKFPVFAGIPDEPGMEHMIATEEEHMKMLVDFTLGWNLFEEYCKAIGTKLLWSSWDAPENINLTAFNQHNNFFEIKFEQEFYDYIMKKRPDGKLESDDIDRRDGHSGKLQHMYWRDKFMDEIEKRGLFDD